MRTQRISLCAVILILVLHGVASANNYPTAANRPVDDFDLDHWKITDPKARIEEYLGRKSLYLTNGVAYIKDSQFENGVIELDMAAPTNLVSFVGVVFRLEDQENYELVYFRPHKSGLEDAVQYTPTFKGAGCWQLYSGQGFTAATVIPKEQWVHVRIEITQLGGSVYFNNSEKPVLIIEDLKRGNSRGAVGLWAFANGGHFSNFTYKTSPSSDGPKKPRSVPAGVLSRWELSESFDINQRDIETLPSPSELRMMKWQQVDVEVPGMVVIDRYRRSPSVVPFFLQPSERTGKREGRKVVFARAVVYSDRDQKKRMSFGYSDEATVFLNSEPVFTGKSAFRFRDPGFLGIMNVENDAVYLDLKKGRNEILLAVAEYFGGWGFICRIDDMRGIKFE
jgi:hypothetical protein